MDKKAVPAGEAQTFHCFAKVMQSDRDFLLRQSGNLGVFRTPKSDTGLVDSTFWVVLLQSNDVGHAATFAKTNPNVIGLVKGRGNLGLRVPTAYYTEVRKVIEPDWSHDQVCYAVKVSHKFVLAPVPKDTDKEALQTSGHVRRVCLACPAYPAAWSVRMADWIKSTTPLRIPFPLVGSGP